MNRGIAEAFIGGRSQGEVDLRSAAAVWQSRTAFRILENGEHIREVKLAGRKNPRSSGTCVDLDELIVEGAASDRGRRVIQMSSSRQ